MLTSIDLFSCIGCHALGFSRAGIKTIALCENQPERIAILARRFPGIPIYEDVRGFTYPLKPDIVIGGPPCQSTSMASAIHGRRTGAHSLWPYMLQVCVTLRPSWVVVEQPIGNKGWEAQVSRGLLAAGYHVARAQLAACDFGAPYLRRRVFLVAHSNLRRLEIAWAAIPRALDQTKRAAAARGDWDPDIIEAMRVDASTAGEVDPTPSRQRKLRIQALGDSNPPHFAELIGRVIVQAENE